MTRIRIAVIAAILCALGMAGVAFAATGGFDGDSRHPSPAGAPASPATGKDAPADSSTPATGGQRSITGRVTTPDGRPLEGVMIVPRSSDVPVPELLVTTDANGRYTWGLPAGTYTFGATKTGYAPASQSLRVNAATQKLDFVLQPS